MSLSRSRTQVEGPSSSRRTPPSFGEGSSMEKRSNVRRARRAGFTLLETIVVGLVTVLVGSGLYNLANRSYDSEYQMMNQNAAVANARQAIDMLADNMRSLTALTA